MGVIETLLNPLFPEHSYGLLNYLMVNMANVRYRQSHFLNAIVLNHFAKVKFISLYLARRYSYKIMLQINED